MKCLLLILVFGLVTADKLDRTYLPPPGAKLAGGRPKDLRVPLEYPKGTYPGFVQNVQSPIIRGNAFGPPQDQGFVDEFIRTTAPVDYTTTNYPNIAKATTAIDGYKPPVTISPEVRTFERFGSELTNGNAPSQTLTTGPQNTINIGTTSSPSLSTSRVTTAGNVPSKSGYYNDGLVKPVYGNDISRQNPTNSASGYVQNVAYNQFPNQISDDRLLSNGQVFIPKAANPQNIAQNYQPQAFGYYGGNPMIMISQDSFQQQIDNMRLTPKPQGYGRDFLPVSRNENKQNISEGRTTQSFPMSSISPSSQSIFNNGNSKSTTPPKLADKPFPSTPSPVNTLGIDQGRSDIRSGFRPERPQAQSDRNAVILNYDSAITPEGGFSYSFDTSNGIHMDESGTANDGVKATGSYSYTGDDGKVYSVTYTADENGFRPIGDHLPTSSPLPEAIVKLIEQAAKDQAAGIIDDGSYDERKYGHMNYLGAMDRYLPFADSGFNEKQNLGGPGTKQNGMQRKLANNQQRLSETNNNKKGSSADKLTADSQLLNRRPVNSLEENKNGTPTRPTSVFQDNTNGFRGRGQNIRGRPITSLNDNQRGLLTNNDDQNALQPTKNPDNINIAQASSTMQPFSSDNGQVRYVNGRPAPSLNRFNQNEKLQIANGLPQYQTPNIGYQPNFNMNADNLSYYNQPEVEVNPPIQINQPEAGLGQQITIGSVPTFDNGYFYVPPLTKFKGQIPFNQISEQPFSKTITYVTGEPQKNLNEPFYKVTETNTIQNQGISGATPTQTPFEINTAITDSTKLPFETTQTVNSNNRPGFSEYGITQKVSKPGQNDENRLPTAVDIDSSFYGSSTTSMPSQTNKYVNQPIPFDQKTIFYPGFERFQPLGTTIPDIQTTLPGNLLRNLPTTTYRPINPFAGEANLNQPTQVDGFGRPIIPNDVTIFPDKLVTYNDKIYTTIAPRIEESSIFTGYPEREVGVVGDKFQTTTEKGIPTDTKLFTPRGQYIITTTSSVINREFGKPALSDSSKDSIATDGIINGGVKPAQKPIYFEGPTSTERVIGEDFSGPRQPQRFDPETGYYYK